MILLQSNGNPRNDGRDPGALTKKGYHIDTRSPVTSFTATDDYTVRYRYEELPKVTSLDLVDAGPFSDFSYNDDVMLPTIHAHTGQITRCPDLPQIRSFLLSEQMPPFGVEP